MNNVTTVSVYRFLVFVKFSYVFAFLFKLLEHSDVVYSRVFHPCHLVPSFPLPRFPPLSFRAEFSTPAFSTPVISCRIFHSRVFHSRVLRAPPTRRGPTIPSCRVSTIQSSPCRLKPRSHRTQSRNARQRMRGVNSHNARRNSLPHRRNISGSQ